MTDIIEFPTHRSCQSRPARTQGIAAVILGWKDEINRLDDDLESASPSKRYLKGDDWNERAQDLYGETVNLSHYLARACLPQSRREYERDPTDANLRAYENVRKDIKAVALYQADISRLMERIRDRCKDSVSRRLRPV